MAASVKHGTFKLDASSWTRLKRINASRNLSTSITSTKDISNPEPKFNSSKYPGFGSSRIRRPTSNWIDFKAFSYSDYPVQNVSPNTENSTIVRVTRYCNCSTYGFGCPYYAILNGGAPGSTFINIVTGGAPNDVMVCFIDGGRI